MMATALDQSQRDSLGGEPVLESVSITPPQSANGKKEAPEGVPSELSDLELDNQSAPAPDTTKIKQEEVENKVEEIEEIEPDHYYGGGKVPVFKPVSTLRVPRLVDDPGLEISPVASDWGVEHTPFRARLTVVLF